MDGIDFTSLPVGIAMSLILIGLFWKLIAREDSSEKRKNEEMKAFVDTLGRLNTNDAAIQEGLRATQVMVTEVSNGLKANAEATAKIFDTGVASSADIKKILDKIEQTKCNFTQPK